MKPTDIGGENTKYDWVYSYLPSDDGADGLICGTGGYSNSQYTVTGSKSNWCRFAEPFFIKSSDNTIWIDGDNVPNDLAYNVNWGLYTISNGNASLKYVIPMENNDVTLEELLKEHSNKIQITTNETSDKLIVNVNNIEYVNVKLSSLNLNKSQKHYFGFDLRNDIQDIKITKLISYSKNIDATITLTHSNSDNHYSTSDNIQLMAQLKDEYGKIVSETIRLYCNDETNVIFDLSDGKITKESGTKYFLATTDANYGRVFFNLKNTTDTATSFSVQAHLSRNYLYNYAISNSVKCYFKTQPTIDISKTPNSKWYEDGMNITISSYLQDNKGNKITSDYSGKVYINDVLVNDSWNGTNFTYPVETEPPSDTLRNRYLVKWVFEGNDLYYPTEISKTVTVKKAKLTIELTGLKEEYNYPEKPSFYINVTCDNPNYTIPAIHAYLDGEEVEIKNNKVTSEITQNGVHTYEVAYLGEDNRIGIANVRKTFTYNILHTSLNITGTNEYYVNQKTNLTAWLEDDYQNSLSDKTIKINIKITDDENNVTTYNKSLKTTELGYVVLEQLYENENDQIGARGEIIFTFEGDGILTPCSTTHNVVWKKKSIDTITLVRTNPNAVYPEPIKLKGTYVREAGSTESVKGLTIRCMRGGKEIGTAVTDKNGVVTFTDNPEPTNKGNPILYTLHYDGDDAHRAIMSNKLWEEYIRNIYLNVESNGDLFLPNERVIFSIGVSDDQGPLKSSVGVSIVGHRYDGTLISPDDVYVEWEEYENHSDKFNTVLIPDYDTFEPQMVSKVAGVFDLTFISYTTPNATQELRITYAKRDLTLVPVNSNPKEIYFNNEATLKFEVQDAHSMERLSNVDVQTRWVFLTEDGKEYTGEKPQSWVTVTSDKNGIISRSYKLKNPKAGIIAKLEVKVGDNNYNEWSTSTQVKFVRKNSHLVLSSSTNETETLTKGIIVVKLLDDDGNIIEGEPVFTEIEWKDFDGKNTTVSGKDETGLKWTNELGKVTAGFTPLNKGDIIGTITFNHPQTDNYNESTYVGSLKWNKIETEITADDVTIYNGRYTNLEKDSPVWTKTSPGVEKTYNNFHAVLKTKNTQTNYVTVPNATLNYINYKNTILFTTNPVAEDGSVSSRWTRTYQNVPANYEIYVEYVGNDIFKSCKSPLMFKILKREATSLTKHIEEIHPPDLRYNVPFKFGAILKDELSNPMASQNVTLYFDEKNIGNIITTKDGIAQTEYTVKDVKTCTVKAEFDKNDLIDKYLPSNLSYNITIQKDYTILTITTGTTVYKSCGDASIKYVLTDSLKRPLDAEISMYYDDGSYNSEKWIPLAEETKWTDNKGIVQNTIEAYSGIRLLKAEYEGSWCYLPVTGKGEVEYDITRTYADIPLVDGKAEIPIDCYIDATKGLPNGLYDVQLEYIPPDTETGKCPLYASATNFQPLRKKKSAKLICLTEERETACNEPLFLLMQLLDIAGNPIYNVPISSTIRNFYPSTPKHITSGSGTILRGYCENTPNYTNNYEFKSEQTREYADDEMTIPIRTTKIRPILEIDKSELIGVRGIDMELKAKLYYEIIKYDKYGYEIRKTTDGKEVYYNPLAENNDSYPEYYYIEDKVQKATTKSVYTNAETQKTIYYIKNKDIIWRGVNKKTELIRARTNSDGVAVAYYSRNTANTVTIYATSEEDKRYYATEKPIQVTTKEMIDPYLEEYVNYGTNESKGIYHHNVVVGAYLKYKDEDGHEHPLVDAEVTIKTKSGVFTEKTDNAGLAAIELNMSSISGLDYQVIYRRTDSKSPYNSTSAIYTVKVNPQTPILSLTVNKNEINLTESITAEVRFNEDRYSGYTPIVSNKIYILMTDSKGNSKKITGIKTQAVLDDKGKPVLENDIPVCKANIDITPTMAGNITLIAKYDGQPQYNATSSDSVTVQVNKIPTEIIHQTNSSDNDIQATLYECKYIEENGITKKQRIKIIPYQKLSFKDKNDGKFVEYSNEETDANGNATGNGAFLKIGEHDIKIEFAGNDKYYASDDTFKFNAQFIIDTCNDLRSWDTIIENWYASDGSAKPGFEDVNGINQMCVPKGRNEWYENELFNSPNYKIYKLNGSHVNGTPKIPCADIAYSYGTSPERNYSLREYCGDLKTKAYVSSDGIHIPTGVCLRNKYVNLNDTDYAESPRTISFKMMLKYNDINKTNPKNGKPVSDMYGGHFGLMDITPENATHHPTAEQAPVRVEMYRGNQYVALASGKVRTGNIRYNYKINTWYSMELKMEKTKVTLKIINEDGSVLGTEGFDETGNYLSKLPYLFAFTNGTEMVIREMKLTLD